VYLDLRSGSTIEVADPATSGAWDVALSRTRIATNGGTSGAGAGAAADPGLASLALITAATGTFVVDAPLAVPGPPGSGTYSGNPALAGWYDYDAATHAVSPKPKAYVIRTADGGFAKLAITAYQSGTYTIDWAYAGAGRSDF
jgi:hypothetical protein